jgi:hypothetical protein
MELLVKPEILTSYIYMDLRLATLKAVSFYLLHNVSTLNQFRNLPCGTVVCKHFDSYQVYPNYRFGRLRVVYTYIRTYTVEPRFTNNSVHEQIFGAKTISDNERCLGLGTRKLGTTKSWDYRRGIVSCCLTLAQYTSLLVFAVPSVEFHYVLCCFLIYY